MKSSCVDGRAIQIFGRLRGKFIEEEIFVTIIDYDDIRRTAQLYIDGGNGDSSIMKPAFHKNATINGAPIVDVLDATGDVAAIRITMENWHGQNFVDYHLLRKEADGWKIIAKVFTETK